jgi:hypothetical protein
MRQPFRLEPQGPAQAYKTYAISSPLATHTRVATCKDVACPRHMNGWKTIIDPATTLGRSQLNYIRMHAGRRYVDASLPGEALVTLMFPAEQKCFEEHRVPLDRPAHYLTRLGDWRAHLGGVHVHARPEHWVEDFAEHQAALAERVNRG